MRSDGWFEDDSSDRGVTLPDLGCYYTGDKTGPKWVSGGWEATRFGGTSSPNTLAGRALVGGCRDAAGRPGRYSLGDAIGFRPASG